MENIQVEKRTNKSLQIRKKNWQYTSTKIIRKHLERRNEFLWKVSIIFNSIQFAYKYICHFFFIFVAFWVRMFSLCASLMFHISRLYFNGRFCLSCFETTLRLIFQYLNIVNWWEISIWKELFLRVHMYILTFDIGYI